jgi:hypothetical protein
MACTGTTVAVFSAFSPSVNCCLHITQAEVLLLWHLCWTLLRLYCFSLLISSAIEARRTSTPLVVMKSEDKHKQDTARSIAFLHVNYGDGISNHTAVSCCCNWCKYQRVSGVSQLCTIALSGASISRCQSAMHYCFKWGEYHHLAWRWFVMRPVIRERFSGLRNVLRHLSLERYAAQHNYSTVSLKITSAYIACVSCAYCGLWCTTVI